MAFFRKDPQQVAEKLVKKGRIEAAIKEFKKVLEKDPDDPNILNRIGDLYVRLRKSSEAADYYQQTAQRYAGDGFYVKAIAVYKKIHRIEPSRYETLLRLAELYERQGLVNDARAHYQQLAEHYARQRDHRSVVETYRRMVDLEPDNPGHRLKLADAYRQLGKLDESLTVYLDLGRLMLAHGHVDHAVQVYERAIELAPEDLDTARAAASALAEAGDLEAARGLIETAAAANPDAEGLQDWLERRRHSAATVEVEADPDAAPDDDRIVLEVDDEEGELEGWQAVPEAIGGLAAADDPPGLSIVDDAGELGSLGLDSEDGDDDAFADVSAVEEVEAEVPEDGLWEISGSWSFADDGGDEDDVEVELDPLEGLSTVAESSGDEPAAAAAGPREELPDPPAPSVESAAERERHREDREKDLLAEADVFIKYGLSQKAVERLEDLLAVSPTSSGAIERLLAARLERGEEQAVVELARRVRDGELGRGEESWRIFERGLGEAGYRLEADRLLALDTGSRAAVESGEVEVWSGREDDATSLVSSELDEWSEDSAADHPPDVSGPLEPPLESEVIAPAALEFGSDGSEGLADSDLLDSSTRDAVPSSWLEDEPAGEEGDGERIFEEERQFFDLASELRTDLEKEVGDAVERADEQSLDEIVEGFKRGVAENISEEDSDTHYNLGIAYREMMLIDEAIGEFQIAAKSPDHRADACAMLGQCYRDKGMGELAVKWYQRALDTESLESAQRAGVLYELAQTFESMDDRESAYYTYLELRGVDSTFRDVRERIDALQ